MESVKKNYDIVNDFKLNQEKQSLIRHRSGGQQELKTSMIKFNVAACIRCNTSDWIKFISWNNQSLHCSRIMCWLQPQSLRHISLLCETREKNMKFLSLIVWVIRNSESTTIFLGVPKYWKPSRIVFLFRGSEILYPSLLFGESEILNPLLCCLGDQKFWIPSCIGWESEILNPLLCCSGNQKFWILSCVVWGIRNSESPLLFWGQKSWILSSVLGESEIQNPLRVV